MARVVLLLLWKESLGFGAWSCGSAFAHGLCMKGQQRKWSMRRASKKREDGLASPTAPE